MSELELPSWMSEQHSALVEQNRALMLETEKQSFGIAYEAMLESVSSGTTLRSFCASYHMPIDPVRYRAWLYRDPARREAFFFAKRLSAHVLEEDLVRIADGENPDGTASMEDVQRSKLKVDARKYVMRVNDRERYGEVTQVNTTVTNIDEEKARTMTTVELKAMLLRRVDEDITDLTDLTEDTEGTDVDQ